MFPLTPDFVLVIVLYRTIACKLDETKTELLVFNLIKGHDKHRSFAWSSYFSSFKSRGTDRYTRVRTVDTAYKIHYLGCLSTCVLGRSGAKVFVIVHSQKATPGMSNKGA